MRCSKCGFDLKENERFCPQCGNPTEFSTGGSGSEPMDTPTPEPKKWKDQYTIAAIVAVLVLAGACGFAVRQFNSADKEADAGEYEASYEADYGKDETPVYEEKHFDVTADDGGDNSASGYAGNIQDPAESLTDENVWSVGGASVSKELRDQDYILPGSDSRYLSRSDLEGFTAEDCRLARNEIYARHGRMFQDEALQNYFNSFDWYHPSISPDDFDESMLNDYEAANRDLIVAYESEKGYR